MKILQISMGEELGGIEKLMFNATSKIKNINFEYLTPIEILKDKKNTYNLGVSRKKIIGKIKYNFRLYKFLKKNKYDIVHINSGVFLYLFQVVIISKLAGAKKVIVHSHSVPKTSKIKKIFSTLLVPFYRKKVDCFIACSNLAAASLMVKKEKVIILKNGIDTLKFKFDETIRKEKRKELNISNDVVIYGNVGRIDDNKNQEFLLDIFNNIQKENKKSILLLVGDGPNSYKLKKKVVDLGIENKVIFLGYQENISKILNSIDIFIFPSKSEGFGIAVIEALATGLPTFISTEVPKEVMINDNCIRIESNNSNNWSKIILNSKIKRKKDAYKDIIKNNYDIDFMAKKLTNIYKELIK